MTRRLVILVAAALVGTTRRAPAHPVPADEGPPPDWARDVPPTDPKPHVIAAEPPPPPPPDPPPIHPQSPPPPPEPTPSDAIDKFGFHWAIGPRPHGDDALFEGVFGLGIEHQLVGHWRIFGEYEYLWIGERSDSIMSMSGVSGTGHRAQVGVRRRLASKLCVGDRFDLFVDAELGGGLAIASMPDAVAVIPHGFAGLQLGYDLLAEGPTPLSRVFEAEIGLRLISSRDGIGGTFSVGLQWGD